VKYNSALMSEASGSTGGLTASRNRGGAYFRKRVVPTNPNTVFQQTVRGILGSNGSRWGNILTAEQRNGWDAYALAVPLPNTLGAPHNVGGLGMYNRTNVARVNAGGDQIDDAPTIFNLGEMTDPVIGVVDASADTVSIAFTNTDEWAGEVGSFMVIQGSRAQNPSVNYFKGPYRVAGIIEGSGTPPTSPIVIPLPFKVALGQKVFFQARVSRADGRLSGTFQGFGIVTA